MLETEDTAVVYSAQQPWSEAGAEAGKECPEYNSIISYLSGRHCLCWRLRILLWYTLPNNHSLRLRLGLRLGRNVPSITT